MCYSYNESISYEPFSSMVWGNLCTAATHSVITAQVTNKGPQYAALKIAGSNPAEGLDVCLFSVCYGGGNIYNKLITHSEDLSGV